MRITSLSRTIFQPFGPLVAPVPGVPPSRSFSAPDSGTLIEPLVGGAWADLADAEAGTLIPGTVLADAEAGTLIPGGNLVLAEAGTLIPGIVLADAEAGTLIPGFGTSIDADAGTVLLP
jgi:hypothetical protein